MVIIVILLRLKLFIGINKLFLKNHASIGLPGLDGNTTLNASIQHVNNKQFFMRNNKKIMYLGASPGQSTRDDSAASSTCPYDEVSSYNIIFVFAFS